jgi:hypothetical protein
VARSVKVTLQLFAAHFKRGAGEAQRAAEQLGEAVEEVGAKAGSMGAQVERSSGRSTRGLEAIRAQAKILDDQIAQTEVGIRSLAKAFASTGNPIIFKQISEQQQVLSNLRNVRKILPDPVEMEKASAGLASRLGASLRTAVPPQVAAGIAIGGIAAAPVLGGIIAGAIVGTAGIGGVAGGLALAARNSQVKEAGSKLGAVILGDLQTRSTAFVPAAIKSIDTVRKHWALMGTDLDRVFKSSRFANPLINDLMEGLRKIIGGIADAVDKADPVMNALGDLFITVSTSIGDTFTLLAGDAEEGASALYDLAGAADAFIRTTGGIVHGMAQVHGKMEEFDQQIDKGRNWIEQNNAFKDLGYQIDLTADGFGAGTKEAKAYHAAAMGTATAADFATLKLAGLTDQKIAAMDASGTYRDRLREVNAAMGKSGEEFARMGNSAHNASVSMSMYATETLKANPITNAATIAVFAHKRAVDGDHKALKDLADAQRAQVDPLFAFTEAQVRLKDAQNAVAEATKKHGARSQETKAAVRELGKAAIDLQGAAGGVTERFSGGLTPALTATLKAAGLTEREIYAVEVSLAEATTAAEKYHGQYKATISAPNAGKSKSELDKASAAAERYAGNYEAKVRVVGKAQADRELRELLIKQRALQTGLSEKSASQAIKRDEEATRRGLYGHAASGGHIRGPGTDTSDSVPMMLSNDEFVIKSKSARKIGYEHLNYLNRYGELPAFAAGGRVEWPFRTDASKTKIPPLTKVMSVVGPSFGNWPSGPGSQRGDSGVWRSIVRMIKGSGINEGSFGNGYRPGDPKWHGSGRAVDWMGYNMDRLASFFAAKRPLELIHRTRSRDYAYTRGRNMGSFNNGLMEAHRNHIHIAMANGGVIREPVFGVGASGATYSFAERGPERVLSAGQTAASAGGPSTVVNLSVALSAGANPREAGRQIAEQLQHYLAGGGSINVRGTRVLP